MRKHVDRQALLDQPLGSEPKRIRQVSGVTMYISSPVFEAANDPELDTSGSMSDPKWGEANRQARRRLDRFAGSVQRGTKAPVQMLFADPPWDYGRPNISCLMMPHGRHYPVMPLASICELPIEQIVAKDGELYLWVPKSETLSGIAVAASWGFTTLVDECVWAKAQPGATSGAVLPQHEKLMHWRRGKGLKLTKGVPRLRSVFHTAVTRHSAKPEYFQDGVDLLYPDAVKMELFARRKRRWWRVWGNEV